MNTTDNRKPPQRPAQRRQHGGAVQAPPQPPRGPQQYQGQPVQMPPRRQQAPQRARQGAQNPGQVVQMPPRRQQAPQKPKRRRRTREIVYTPSKPFNRKKLLLQLGIIAAVVAAMMFTLSLFFKVDTITVSGNKNYSVEDVAAASGIQKGDGLLSVNSARVGGKIITKLPYVSSVRIGIKLPGTVNIEITELDVVYSIADDADVWWLMTSGGRLVERVDAAKASEHTKILGVNLSGPSVGQQAAVVEAVPETTGEEGETKPVTVTNSQRLSTALDVLGYLEENGIMGQMVSVDVTNMGNIELMYGQRFRILLGDTSDLEYKISLAVAAAGQLRDYDRGTLDVSFLDRPEVVYTPQVD